jgi:hypothetical protein
MAGTDLRHTHPMAALSLDMAGCMVACTVAWVARLMEEAMEAVEATAVACMVVEVTAAVAVADIVNYTAFNSPVEKSDFPKNPLSGEFLLIF